MKGKLRYDNGTELEIPLKLTSAGTSPKGSTWAMNPVQIRMLFT